MNYMNEREALGRAIARYEGLQFALAEHYTRMEASELLACRALWMYDMEQEGGKARRLEVSKCYSDRKDARASVGL